MWWRRLQLRQQYLGLHCDILWCPRQLKQSMSCLIISILFCWPVTDLQLVDVCASPQCTQERRFAPASDEPQHTTQEGSPPPQPPDCSIPQSTPECYMIGILSIPIFSGNTLQWQSFQDCFEATVHNNPSITVPGKVESGAPFPGDWEFLSEGGLDWSLTSVDLNVLKICVTQAITVIKERFINLLCFTYVIN